MDRARQSDVPDYRNIPLLPPTLPPATRAYIHTEDRQTFASLYEYHKEPLTKHLKALVNNRETAYDLCQDTFVHMWKHFSQPNTARAEVIEYFAPKLYTIARHVAIDYLRHKSKIAFLPLPEREQYATDVLLVQQFSTAGHEQQVCDQLCIEQALAAMSPQYRVCLLLQTKWGLTQHEIAGALGIGIKAVSTNVSRGNRQFRELYTKLSSGISLEINRGRKSNGRIHFSSY